MTMKSIHIYQEMIKQLYDTLHEEQRSAEKMVGLLSLIKVDIEDQKFVKDEFVQVLCYIEALISMMELLSNMMIILREKASKIEECFSQIDKMISNVEVNTDVLR